jgi:antitoxin HicB
MHYVAYISHEDDRVLAEFPDCPGCQTFADDEAAIVEVAREALEGWLEAHLTSGQIPPRPRVYYGAPYGVMARIPVRPGLAAALNIRWARHDAGLSQKALGELAGVSQQQIAKLENPDENPSLETLEKVGKALGLQVSIEFIPFDRAMMTALSTSLATRACEPPPSARKPSDRRGTTQRGKWRDDEILLTFKLYVEIRDDGRDHKAPIQELAKLLERDESAVRAAVFAPAKEDPRWTGSRPHRGLSAPARALWNKYSVDLAGLRRMARQIEARMRERRG